MYKSVGGDALVSEFSDWCRRWTERWLPDRVSPFPVALMIWRPTKRDSNHEGFQLGSFGLLYVQCRTDDLSYLEGS